LPRIVYYRTTCDDCTHHSQSLDEEEIPLDQGRLFFELNDTEEKVRATTESW